ncbi:hypothetical protein SKAU_G00213320 [Synaphobranchus kaupii]|uniref:Uncharacterized protein n=1 Tax=Synaphobranchus kaupii TaxID=118154 RepID=A0A9Q1F9I1_SYNKA|nr:hypothetical protein SKAU_G00213320 [Synaphobranchus kaupii]
MFLITTSQDEKVRLKCWQQPPVNTSGTLGKTFQSNNTNTSSPQLPGTVGAVTARLEREQRTGPQQTREERTLGEGRGEEKRGRAAHRRTASTPPAAVPVRFMLPGAAPASPYPSGAGGLVECQRTRGADFRAFAREPHFKPLHPSKGSLFAVPPCAL